MARLIAPWPSGREGRGSRRSAGGCPEPMWPPAFALRGPEIFFGSRRCSAAIGARERSGAGVVRPVGCLSFSIPNLFAVYSQSDCQAHGGRRGAGPSGLHGFMPRGQSRADAGPCLLRSRFNAGSGSVAGRSDAVSRSIAPRRMSGSWAQDTFPRDGTGEGYARLEVCMAGGGLFRDGC